ncbi:alkylation response protein AidB-like acyl-CoA dehydrogenase [Mycobacterium sp. MAA66]|uniref:acyl-CoA dehydrogenase family protein n=1 Tax=Mycobacterium sp. MAA66 TaxID=3156297 RepID=UPI0035131BF7
MTITSTTTDRVPMSATQILENVRALAAEAAALSDEVNVLGHLTPDLAQKIRTSGALRMAWPAAWGGPGMTFRQVAEIGEILAHADASVAWNTMILGATTGIWAGTWDEATARAIYPSMDMGTSGGFFPPQRADAVPGGWLVNGRWSFASGIHSADRYFVGIHLHRDGKPQFDQTGAPVLRVAMVPPETVTILDTWQVMGLQGTGSTDYLVKDAFVADAHLLDFFGDHGPSAAPLSRYPALIGLIKIGMPIGIAQRILDEAISALQARGGADRHARITLADAAAQVEAARAYARIALDRVDGMLFNGEELDRPGWATASMASVQTAAQCRAAVEMLADLVGTRSIYIRNGLERRRRDLSVASAHVSFQRRSLEAAGAALLGEDFNGQQI